MDENTDNAALTCEFFRVDVSTHVPERSNNNFWQLTSPEFAD